MSDPLKSFLFAVVLCLISSILLTAASTGLQSYQQANMRVDRHRSILLALGLVTESEPRSVREIEAIFSKQVRSYGMSSDGRLVEEDRGGAGLLPLYVRMDDGEIGAYVIPVDSRGLWGRIQGYLAIERDGSTIAGFAVFKHSETPGLGGEIEKEWFRKKWIGKKIVDRNGNFVSVVIAGGRVQEGVRGEKKENYVDGISGATLTGKFLTTGVKEVLEAYEPMAIRFRRSAVTDSKIKQERPENG
ncbi:MAG: FMN-binding protein [Thermodesulfobacteriota bacterium]